MKKEGLEREIERLEKDLERARAQLDEKDKALGEASHQALLLQADFENAKKRWLKVQAEGQEQAYGDLIRPLLDVVDDFERALKSDGPQADLKTFCLGVEMIAGRMLEFLKSYGVVPMEAAGQMFDPSRHEAIAHEATESEAESTVLEELRKGYLMNGRVLRPAVVKVAVKPQGR